MRVPRPAIHLAQGFLMGAFDVVPGVSGGTVALVVGIYERLIVSIRALVSAPVRLVRGDVDGARGSLTETEWGLLLPLGIGILTAIGAGAVVIAPLLESYPAETSATFLGLILASLVVPWRRIGRRDARTLATLVVAAGIAFVLVGLPGREISEPSLPQVAAIAAVAICAMILPGVSGAYLLTALGLYRVTIEAIRGMDLVYIAAFAVGAVAGLGLFARLVETLLVRHRDLTMAALTGLMVGALRALWPWLDQERGLLAPPADARTALAALLCLGAFVGLRALLRIGERTRARV